MHVTNYSDVMDKLNFQHKIKIRLKKRKTKRVFFLEYNHDGKREYEYLGFSITGDKNRDNQNFRVAQSVRDQRENELLNAIAGKKLFQSKLDKKQSELFVDYANEVVIGKIPKTKGFYLSGINSFIDYAGNKATLSSVTKKTVTEWLASSSLSPVTQKNYLRAIKYVIGKAIKAKLIMENPLEDIKISVPESTREYLTADEVQIIAKMDFYKPAVKHAFLFSCFTGLRYGDISRITWQNIKGNNLEFKQSKTGRNQRIKLNKSAKQILSKQTRPSPYVFMLPSRKWFFDAMRKLNKQSGIDKKITFHCARHTFATMLITYDADLYAVSKLLGHMDIQTTQIYAKLIDKKKDEAIDKLPIFEIT